jgi:hypothetical protein
MAMEEIKVNGAKLVEKLKALIKEGNVRRVVLRNPQGRVLLDMPLNAGIAASALLPFWAAVASVAVLATDYTVLVERDPGTSTPKA